MFAGAGGWDKALAEVGHEVVGIELDHPACRAAVNAGHPRIRADVTSYPPERFKDAVGLVASPPCPDFSKAGRRAGLNGVTGRLVYEPVRWVGIVRPQWACFEQVPEVLPIWKLEADKLKALGYRTWVGVLDAADYGTPQNRSRAILLASLTHQPTAPAPTHCEGGREAHASLLGDELGLKPWVSMAEALGWGLTERPCKTIVTARNKQAASACLDSSSWTRRWWKDQQDGAGWMLHTNRDQRPDGSRQEIPDTRPAPAVTAKAGGQWDWAFNRPATTVQSTDRIAQPGHHERQFNDAIKVTVAELGILQGFPADYPWFGTKTQQAKQCGNAIPPQLARACILEASTERAERTAA